jgi:uncharacterized protein (TIGR02217 family)
VSLQGSVVDMSFIEERLLECVTEGTAGGPTWLTRKVALRSGVVKRNAMRSRPLYRFVFVYRNKDEAAHAEIINAYNACMGGLHSFRVKDWSDFEGVDEPQSANGTGAPQTLQLQKVYTFGAESVVRLIRKPVAGTVVVKANGTPISSSVNTTTGAITFTATSGHVITADFEFDVPVMFEDDSLQFAGGDRGVNGLFLTSDVALIEDISA